MSSISSLSSANTYLAYPPANQTGGSQLVQSMNALGAALLSGNGTSAQSALASVQQNLSDNSPSPTSLPFSDNSAANSDYKSLVSNLQSGNLFEAQQAFAKLQTDLKAGHTHGAHHHHEGGAPPPTTSTDSTTTSSTTDSTDGSTGGSVLNVTV